MKTKFRILLIAILLCFPIIGSGQSSSGIIDPARATDWTNAGIPGGIPSAGWSNCVNAACNTVNSGTVTSASVSSALTGAPANTVVRVPAGTFTLATGSISTNRGNVVLRGAGPTQTKLIMTAGDIFIGTNGSGGLGSYPPNLVSTNWTGGLTRGSTVLTVTSTTGMLAGQRIVLDQHNAAWVFPDGVEGTCISGNSCGRNDTPLQFNGAETRAQPQMVEIVSVDSSTQITIAAPGVAFDHTGGLTPQAFFWNSGAGNIHTAGVENMTIDANLNDQAVSIPFCDECWVSNVAIIHIGRAAVFSWWSYRPEIRDSYISASNTSGAPTEYGFELIATTFAKIENNIIFGVTSGILPETSFGTVAAYNYAMNSSTGNQFGSFEPHLSHNFMHLYEGNVVDGIMYDNSWGSSSQNTSFRNRSSGNGLNKTNFRVAMKINSQNHYMNIIGNVLGDVSNNTRYRCDNVDTNQTDNTVYDLGFWNSCEAGIDGLNPYDTTTQSSLFRWGNWDSATYIANGNTNGIRWCTASGTGNAACTVSEVPTTDPTFPNSVPASQTLPSSFYLVSKPSWFGSVIWPPIGPDVTCVTNCIANVGSHAAMIPAQLCYQNGAKDVNGFLTAFDANSCYAATNPSTVAPARGMFAIINRSKERYIHAY